MTPDNSDRAAWAATAIGAFASVCRMDGEDDQTKAKDLATNLVHFLRLECGLSFAEASSVMQSAINRAEDETKEDSDGDEEFTYVVQLRAIKHLTVEIEVTAPSMAEARQIALRDAGNVGWDPSEPEDIQIESIYQSRPSE